MRPGEKRCRACGLPGAREGGLCPECAPAGELLAERLEDRLAALEAATEEDRPRVLLAALRGGARLWSGRGPGGEDLGELVLGWLARHRPPLDFLRWLAEDAEYGHLAYATLARADFERALRRAPVWLAPGRASARPEELVRVWRGEPARLMAFASRLGSAGAPDALVDRVIAASPFVLRLQMRLAVRGARRRPSAGSWRVPAEVWRRAMRWRRWPPRWFDEGGVVCCGRCGEPAEDSPEPCPWCGADLRHRRELRRRPPLAALFEDRALCELCGIDRSGALEPVVCPGCGAALGRDASEEGRAPRFPPAKAAGRVAPPVAAAEPLAAPSRRPRPPVGGSCRACGRPEANEGGLCPDCAPAGDLLAEEVEVRLRALEAARPTRQDRVRVAVAAFRGGARLWSGPGPDGADLGARILGWLSRNRVSLDFARWLAEDSVYGHLTMATLARDDFARTLWRAPLWLAPGRASARPEELFRGWGATPEAAEGFAHRLGEVRAPESVVERVLEAAPPSARAGMRRALDRARRAGGGAGLPPDWWERAAGWRRWPPAGFTVGADGRVRMAVCAGCGEFVAGPDAACAWCGMDLSQSRGLCRGFDVADPWRERAVCELCGIDRSEIARPHHCPGCLGRISRLPPVEGDEARDDRVDDWRRPERVERLGRQRHPVRAVVEGGPVDVGRPCRACGLPWGDEDGLCADCAQAGSLLAPEPEERLTALDAAAPEDRPRVLLAALRGGARLWSGRGPDGEDLGERILGWLARRGPTLDFARWLAEDAEYGHLTMAWLAERDPDRVLLRAPLWMVPGRRSARPEELFRAWAGQPERLSELAFRLGEAGAPGLLAEGVLAEAPASARAEMRRALERGRREPRPGAWRVPEAVWERAARWRRWPPRCVEKDGQGRTSLLYCARCGEFLMGRDRPCAWCGGAHPSVEAEVLVAPESLPWLERALCEACGIDFSARAAPAFCPGCLRRIEYAG